ncbi:MAG: UDP-glucose 4-epimerase GalE [Syntrophales bacterium]
MKTIFVTGGAGYIGSHTCVELLQAGYDVVIADNLSNSKSSVLDRIETITGRRPIFYHVDCRDRAALKGIFASHPCDAVIHFAGLKAVGESVARPLHYYDNNVGSTVALCGVMADCGLKRIVFSSSATVYGDPATVPIGEEFPLAPANPYGRTKLMIEEILRDLRIADPAWQITLLRYFNPVGAHESGLMGEDPTGIPNNLMPYISQVAVGKLPRLSVFGNDYDTPDGTGVRDYIHVVDLARGHLKALEKIKQADFATYNLGAGRGYSVLEMINAFEKASGRPIPYDIVDRRPGDIAVCYADAGLAKANLNWTASRGLDAMCADTWRWQSRNPNGYPEKNTGGAL